MATPTTLRKNSAGGITGAVRGGIAFFVQTMMPVLVTTCFASDR